LRQVSLPNGRRHDPELSRRKEAANGRVEEEGSERKRKGKFPRGVGELGRENLCRRLAAMRSSRDPRRLEAAEKEK
jgi:hypothetical protein